MDRQILQEAYDAAGAGDVSSLVGLLHPDLDWRGVERGRLWWKKAPA